MRIKYLFILYFLLNITLGCKQNNAESIDSKKNKIDTSLLRALSITGEQIFKKDCNMCHGGKEKTDNILTNVVQRFGVDYLQLFITKQDSLIKSKNKYALAVKKEYGNNGNSHNFKYTKYELVCLIAYINEQ